MSDFHTGNGVNESSYDKVKISLKDHGKKYFGETDRHVPRD